VNRVRDKKHRSKSRACHSKHSCAPTCFNIWRFFSNDKEVHTFRSGHSQSRLRFFCTRQQPFPDLFTVNLAVHPSWNSLFKHPGHLNCPRFNSSLKFQILNVSIKFCLSAWFDCNILLVLLRCSVYYHHFVLRASDISNFPHASHNYAWTQTHLLFVVGWEATWWPVLELVFLLHIIQFAPLADHCRFDLPAMKALYFANERRCFASHSLLPNHCLIISLLPCVVAHSAASNFAVSGCAGNSACVANCKC